MKTELISIQAKEVNLPEFSSEHLGKLIIAVQTNFPTNCVIPLFYCENNKRGNFKLFITHGLNSFGQQEEHHNCYNDRLKEIETFIKGFISGVK